MLLFLIFVNNYYHWICANRVCSIWRYLIYTIRINTYNNQQKVFFFIVSSFGHTVTLSLCVKNSSLYFKKLLTPSLTLTTQWAQKCIAAVKIEYTNNGISILTLTALCSRKPKITQCIAKAQLKEKWNTATKITHALIHIHVHAYAHIQLFSFVCLCALRVSAIFLTLNANSQIIHSTCWVRAKELKCFALILSDILSAIKLDAAAGSDQSSA